MGGGGLGLGLRQIGRGRQHGRPIHSRRINVASSNASATTHRVYFESPAW